jgi:hypothetical protein
MSPARPEVPRKRRRKVDLDDEFAPAVGFEEGAEGETSTAARARRPRKKRRPSPEERERLAKLRKRRKKMLRRREGRIRPSPPLQETDPLAAYLAGEMVPCPVGCGGFSEIVRVGTLESGAGEVWFECLSCAQRRMFEVPAATEAESAAIASAGEEGHEPHCPRHGRPTAVRRRGRQFVCPACGVVFSAE